MDSSTPILACLAAASMSRADSTKCKSSRSRIDFGDDRVQQLQAAAQPAVFPCSSASTHKCEHLQVHAARPQPRQVHVPRGGAAPGRQRLPAASLSAVSQWASTTKLSRCSRCTSLIRISLSVEKTGPAHRSALRTGFPSHRCDSASVGPYSTVTPLLGVLDGSGLADDGHLDLTGVL